MRYMRSSVNFQGERVTRFLLQYLVGGLQMAIHPSSLPFFHSILLGIMIYGSHLLQFNQDPLKILLYMSILIPFPSSWTSSHFLLGINMVSLLHSLHPMCVLHPNLPSLIKLHLYDTLISLHNFLLAYSPC